jgi:DNA-directed RNA polymerase subunit RPC12/RpoP
MNRKCPECRKMNYDIKIGQDWQCKNCGEWFVSERIKNEKTI